MRLLGAMLLAAALVFVACGDDDDDATTAGAAQGTATATRTATAVAAASDGFESLRDQDATAQGAIDNRSLAAPARDTIFSCTAAAMGEALDRPWVDADGTIRFGEKPVVEGAIAWASAINIVVGDTTIEISGNALPDHPTGEFPADGASEAWQFDANPNSIGAGALSYELPAEPAIAAEPTCLPMGPIGIALTGAVIFNALDADLRDAVANEVFDACEGHPAPRNVYHYHHGSPCFASGAAGSHSPLVGYALDGFAIYGPNDVDGTRITNADLDECHGHVSPLPIEDGEAREAYHYHLNNEFPYTLGCFRGEVDVRVQGRPASETRPG